MAFHVFPAFFGRSSPSKLGLLLLVLSLALLLRCFQLSTTVLATQEAFSWRLTSYPAAQAMRSCGGGAVLCALHLAIHDSQVSPSRCARMYSPGAFMRLLTASLLLRARRATRGREVWWLAYAIAVAAFCYTHYFAFFTI